MWPRLSRRHILLNHTLLLLTRSIHTAEEQEDAVVDGQMEAVELEGFTRFSSVVRMTPSTAKYVANTWHPKSIGHATQNLLKTNCQPLYVSVVNFQLNPL